MNKTVYLVGDSTVSNYPLEPDRYYPRNGYGMVIGEYFKEGVEVCNLALPGRSSLSFLKEDNYEHLVKSLKSGDVLIIGFGHNDQKPDERFTTPSADFSDTSSIGYTLKTHYIDLARKKGAAVVLCTPIARRSLENDYTAACGHVTKDGDYHTAILDTALKLKVSVIDMTALTIKLYLSLGAQMSKRLHASNDLTPDNTDNTHLNSYGARVIALTLLKSAINGELTEITGLIDQAKLVEPDFDQTITITK